MLIYKSDEFLEWLKKLRDRQGRYRIAIAIDRMADGRLGDIRPVGSGVSEMRLHFGPGYRLYFFSHGNSIYYLLAGGDKSTQTEDIKRAIEMKAKALETLK